MLYYTCFNQYFLNGPIMRIFRRSCHEGELWSGLQSSATRSRGNLMGKISMGIPGSDLLEVLYHF